MEHMNVTDDEKTTEKTGEAAPPSAQNPEDTKPHEGEHSPDKAKGGASDSDGANG